MSTVKTLFMQTKLTYSIIQFVEVLVGVNKEPAKPTNPRQEG